MWSLLWQRPFSDFLNFRTATSFEFGNGKDALQPKTISTKWYGNIPDSPDWVPGNVWKRNIRWFWDLDHHGEIASRKKIPTLRTGLMSNMDRNPVLWRLIGNSFLAAGGVAFRSVQFAVFQEKMCKKWAAITLKNYDGANCSPTRHWKCP